MHQFLAGAPGAGIRLCRELIQNFLVQEVHLVQLHLHVEPQGPARYLLLPGTVKSFLVHMRCRCKACAMYWYKIGGAIGAGAAGVCTVLVQNYGAGGAIGVGATALY